MLSSDGETRGDLLASAARGRARGDQSRVLDVLPVQLLAVVEPAEVLELPQELHGRLRAVRLPRGHVHVVDEENDFFIRRSAEFRLSLLLELGLDQQLRVVRGRLRAEVDDDVHETFLFLRSLQVVGDDDRLPNPGAADEEQALVYFEARLQQKRKPRRVHVRDEELEVRHGLAVVERLHDVVPRRELPFRGVLILRDDVPVVHGALRG
eukprot:31550-Pelagococcus_subviridis.AAC.14